LMGRERKHDVKKPRNKGIMGMDETGKLML
jgi:hypothetical protein